MSNEHTLPSGAIMCVTLLSAEEAWGIAQKIIKLIGKLDLNLKGVSFENIMAQDVLEFKGPICEILSAPETLESAKKCWTRCTYNGVKIDTTSHFNSPENRGDFLFAAYYALVDNVSPFFASLASFFATASKTIPQPVQK